MLYYKVFSWKVYTVLIKSLLLLGDQISKASFVNLNWDSLICLLANPVVTSLALPEGQPHP